jgi:hypothetical protein
MALARPLAVGAPHRAEGAVLRAASDGLHRCPHIASGRQQIPPPRQEAVGFDAAAGVLGTRRSGGAVAQDLGPDSVAVAGDDRMGAAELVRLVGIERRVNAAEHHRRSGGPRRGANLVAAQGITGMDADSDDVAGTDLGRVEQGQGLVGEHRIAVDRRGRCGEHVQPARRDHPNPERHVARVDEVHGDLAIVGARAAGRLRQAEPHETVAAVLMSAVSSGEHRLQNPADPEQQPHGERQRQAQTENDEGNGQYQTEQRGRVRQDRAGTAAAAHDGTRCRTDPHTCCPQGRESAGPDRSRNGRQERERGAFPLTGRDPATGDISTACSSCPMLPVP